MSAPSSSETQTAVSLRSVSLVSVFSIGQLVLLFVLQLVLAKLFGASKELDIYMAVLAVPLVVSAVLSGSLGSVIIPLSQELNEQHSPATATAILNRLGWGLVTGSCAIAFGLALAAEPITQFLYAGWTETEHQLGTELLVMLTGLIPLNTLTGFLFSIYHTGQRYLLPAVSGLVGPALTVGIVAAFPQAGVRGIAWAVLAGGIAGVTLLLPGFPKAKHSAALPLKSAFTRFARLIWPLVLGAIFFRLDPIVDRHLAVAGNLSDGSISHLSYAGRLVSAIAVLASSGLSIVAFPALARHAALGDEDKFASEIAHGWRFLCVVLVPIIAALLCYNQTLVSWLLERGEFTADDTKAVARLLCLYTGVIFGAGLGEMSTRAFFALGRMWVPTMVSILGFTLSTAAKFALVSRYQAEGLAFLTSAQYFINALVFLLLLRWCVNGAIFQQFLRTLFRTLFCTIWALGMGRPLLLSGHGFHVPLGIAICVLSYFALQWILKDEFAIRIGQGVKRVFADGKRQRGETEPQ